MIKDPLNKSIYLVIDPAMEERRLLHTLSRLVKGPLAAVQIWDHFLPGMDIKKRIDNILSCCHAYQIPVLINNQTEWLKHTALDGVHFDHIPANFETWKKNVSGSPIIGITCNNDLSVVEWARDQQLDYISFCSMFPSATANSCELVRFETIKAARLLTAMPLFLAGGIQPHHIERLNELDYDGVALVSGIMGAMDPQAALMHYYQKLNQQ